MSKKFSLKFIYKDKTRTVLLSAVFAFLAVVTLVFTILSKPDNFNNNNHPPFKTPQTNGVSNYAVINMGSEPITLNSLKATDSYSKNVLRHVSEGLVRLDKDGKPVPGVALSWEVSKDNLTWTFHLRDNSRWSDGSVVTANDFVFTFTNLLNGNGSPEYTEQMRIFKNADSFLEGKSEISKVGFEAKDNTTLILTLKRPEPNLLIMLADTQFAPTNKTFFEKNTTKYGAEPDTLSYNGPWYIREWHHNERIVLIKNSYYWNYDSVHIDQVLFISSGNTESKIQRLKQKSYDFIYIPTYDIEAYLKEKFKTGTYNDGSVAYLEFNTKDSVMSNIHLRKALSYGINRESFVNETLKNGSVAAYSLINPGAFYGNLGDFKIENGYFSDNISQKDLMAEAKAELALAKKELDKNQLASIKITVDDSEASISFANALANQWKVNLDLVVSVEALSYSDRVSKIQSNDYQIMINSWDIAYPSLENVLQLLDKNNNFSNYDSEEFFTKLNSIYSESDLKNKTTLIEEAFKLLKNDMPVAPLYYKSKNYISLGTIQNVIVDSYRDIDLYYASSKRSSTATNKPTSTPVSTPSDAENEQETSEQTTAEANE